MRKIAIVTLLLLSTISIYAQKKTRKNKRDKSSAERMVEINTSYGNITVRLYDSTPLHRDNFVKLVQEGFYDSLLFHRVIDSFMIQGGDPTSKDAADSVMLGDGEAPGLERIPAEFNRNYFHKRGALAAARDDNPEKASSNCQFYIVQGKKFNDTSLNEVECRLRAGNPGFYFTNEERDIYKTIGGTPHLDQNYTVFGEVVSGMEVVDKIAAAKRDGFDRPLENIMMKMRMLN